jgi:class 3 adenylate cyclase
MARVRSLLRVKSLYDEVQRQHAELQVWNATLERRVSEGVQQLERMGQLKRFFSPQLAEAIIAGGADNPLHSHRRDITVVFLDLRGFTAFTETAEPEEVMAVLAQYHAVMGRLVVANEGTLERFSGDGMMIFFNDPQPVPDAPARAVRMAVQMQREMVALHDQWRLRGYDLHMGIGVAQGFATLGSIGFEGRIDYGAIGTVTNLAARLCGEAGAGEILISQRVQAALQNAAPHGEGGAEWTTQPVGELELKGFARKVPASRIVPLASP